MGLDVYLVPVGEAHYELYSEHAPDEPPPPPADPAAPKSWGTRQMDKFRAMLAEAELERRRLDRGEPSPGGGLWRAIMRRIAETIAEQRLLWRLRAERAARLVHPLDLDMAEALRVMRTALAKDLAKHRRWCVIDAGTAAILGPVLFLVPGPNIVAYYFLFRFIGHYLALRGATHGLSKTVWETHASAPLMAIRLALALPRAERRAELDGIARALGLAHLTGFVERVARPI